MHATSPPPGQRRQRSQGRRLTAIRLPTASLWRTERRVHLVVLLALAGFAAYLAWRFAFTLSGAPPWLAIPLFAVEAWSIGQLALFAWQAWNVPADDPHTDGVAPEPRGVLVRLLGADPDELERTLIGTSRLAGSPPVTVVADDLDSRPELQELSARHGARFVRAADQSLREALRAAPGELVLLLQAGEVPAPETLEAAAGRMGDRGVAAVQCAIEYANPDALTHVLAGRSEQALLTNVVGPALGVRGLGQSSASALVLRRSTFAAAAPRHARTPNEEALRTEAAVLSAGRRIVFQRSPAVRTLGPDSVRDYVAKARSRAADALRFLMSRQGPLLSRGVPARVRFALAARASRYFSGLHRVVLIGIVGATFVSGSLPFGAPLGEFAMGAAPAYALILAAWLALGRGALDPGDRTRQSLRTMGAYCRGALAALAPSRVAQGLIRPRGSRTDSLRQMGLLVGCTLALDAALIARGLNDRLDLGLPPMASGWTTAALMGAGLVNVAFMLDVLQLMKLRRQDRRHYRVPVALAATVDGIAARCTDLTPGGLRLSTHHETDLAEGRVVTVEVDITDLDRSSRTVRVPAVVRRAAGTTLGLEIDPTAIERHAADTVASFYWVTRPAELARGIRDEGVVDELEGPVEPLSIRTRAGRLSLRGASAAAAAAATLALFPVLAFAALPQQSGVVDLLDQYNVRIDMAGAGDSTGAAEAHPAGDVNGDGFDDVIIGSDNADPLGRANAGAAYVIFGSSSPAATLDAANLGSAGFRIAGATPGARTGDSAGPAGDVNGDGYDDLIVGAESELGHAGASYVVFGAASAADVDLATIVASGRGFRIHGAPAGAFLGQAGVPVGDLNGDGLDDVLVTAYRADPLGRTDAGAAFVVLGKTTTTPVDVSSDGAWGYAILGRSAGDWAGWRAAAVGDLNDDGLVDVVLGARHADPGGRTDAGAAFVVFGRSTMSTVDLAHLGTRGFAIKGAAAGDLFGESVSGAGDLNGDSVPDVIVGADGADPSGRTNAGAAYVIYGKADSAPVDAATLGASGFRIDGAAAGDAAGWAVGRVPDMNGDGRPDVVVGAHKADPAGRANAGAAYVVFGTPSPAAVDLATLAAQGVEIRGAAPGDGAGHQLAAGGADLNGDGRQDVIVGAQFADNNARNNSGSAYVVFGWGPTSVEYAPSTVTAETGSALPPITPTIARTGAAVFSIAPALPPGLAIDTATGVISGTPTLATTATAYTVTMTDLAGKDSDQLTISTVSNQPAPPAPAPAPGPAPGTPGSPPPAETAEPGRTGLDLPARTTVIPSPRVARFDAKRDAFIIRVRFKLRGARLCRPACRATAAIHERVRTRAGRATRKAAPRTRASRWRTRKRLGAVAGLRIRTRKAERFEIPVRRTLIGQRSVRTGGHLRMLVRLSLRIRTRDGWRRVRKDSLIRVSVKRYKRATKIRGGFVTTTGRAAPARGAASLGRPGR